MRSSFVAAFLLALATNLNAQAPEHLPGIDGYVTRVGSPSDFDVNGFWVILTRKTAFAIVNRVLVRADLPKSTTKITAPDPYVGAHALVFGKLDKRKSTITAEEVQFVVPDGAEVKGFGLIDSLPTPGASYHDGKLVRADGYRILLASRTEITFTPPLTSLSEVGPNVWISYKGEQRKDGVVVASSAVVTANQIKSGEQKLRDKWDYDPVAVSASNKQSEASKLLIGVNPKKLPPYHDDAMQARITKIGNSLVPQYQKSLPDTDPAKVRFQFQVVDESVWRDGVSLPGGVILISKQVVDRMQNDSQLAAVMADSIASVLEKETYRLLPLKHKVEVAEIATLAAPLAVGVPVALVSSKMYADAVQQAQDQCGRISLGLMKDAGYDLAEAPRAYWILSSKSPKPLVDLKLPEHVAYLYQVLGTTWRNQ